MTRTGADALAQITAELAPAAATAVLTTKRLDVALIADAELAALDGANTEANAIARLNLVDGIFSTQVGVQLRVAGTTILDAATQPFTTTVASALLDQLASYRQGSGLQQANGLSHLMTGRSLDGQNVGIAFIASIRSRSFGASLSGARTSVPFDALIAAHEIGHAFGAPHDGDPAAACAATSSTDFLMAPRLNGSSTFSECSLQEIAKVVATAKLSGADRRPGRGASRAGRDESGVESADDPDLHRELGGHGDRHRRCRDDDAAGRRDDRRWRRTGGLLRHALRGLQLHAGEPCSW